MQENTTSMQLSTQWRIQRGEHGARAPPSHFLIRYLKATTLTAN